MQHFEPFTVDTGHSSWKGLWRNKAYIIPALVAGGQLKEENNGVFEPDYSAASIDNIAIETDFGPRYIGNLAKQSQAGPWAAFDKAKYGRAEFMLPMLIGAISEARVSGDLIVLITAVPAEWAKDEALKAQIERLFLTTHVIKRAGKRGEKTVNIARVAIVSETGGLLYSHLLNNDGSLADDDYQAKRYAVIDIGEHTTCIDLFSGLSREGKTRSYSNISMGLIHEAVARQITELTGRHLEPWQVRDIVRGPGHIATTKGRQFDIMPLYQAEINAAKDQLFSVAGQTIKNAADISHLLVGGGGSEILGDVLTASYPQTQILGQLATARGLHNYGRRLCKALNNR